MPSGPSSEHKQRCMVLRNIQGSVSQAWPPALDNELDVSHLAECCLRDCLTLIKLRLLLTIKQAGPKSRMADIHLLEEQGPRLKRVQKHFVRRLYAYD